MGALRESPELESLLDSPELVRCRLTINWRYVCAVNVWSGIPTAGATDVCEQVSCCCNIPESSCIQLPQSNVQPCSVNRS